MIRGRLLGGGAGDGCRALESYQPRLGEVPVGLLRRGEHFFLWAGIDGLCDERVFVQRISDDDESCARIGE